MDGLNDGGEYGISDAGALGIDDKGTVYARGGVTDTDKQRLKWNYENDPSHRQKYADEAKTLRDTHKDYTVTADKPLSYYRIKPEGGASYNPLDGLTDLSSALKTTLPREPKYKKYKPVFDDKAWETDDLKPWSADDNYRENNKYTFSGYLNGQSVGDLAKMRYGNHTMDYNGCEIIAMYNALQKLGNPQKLNDVANWGEHNAIMRNGKWGTNALKIPRFFNRLGYDTTVEYEKYQFDTAAENADASILCYWNNWNDPRTGVHTVYIQKQTDGSILAYNFDTYKSRPIPFRSIRELLRSGNMGHSSLYLIHK